MLAQWREQGLSGPRLRAMALSFNTHYDGTRGGELSPKSSATSPRSPASPDALLLASSYGAL